MSKSAKLSMAAAQMAKDTQAFVILKIDSKGMASVQADGNVFETVFMEKALSNFNFKLINGEIKNQCQTS